MIALNTTIDYTTVRYIEIDTWKLDEFKKGVTILGITALKRIYNDHHGYKEKVELGILYTDNGKEKEHVHNR